MRKFPPSKSMLVILGSAFLLVALPTDGARAETPNPEIKTLLEKARLAHGLNNQKIRTYREVYSLNASILGVGVYNVKVNYLLDFSENRGYFDMLMNGEAQFRVLVSQAGMFVWTKKAGTERKGDGIKRGEPLGVDAPFHAGVLGVLALEQQKAKLSFDADDQIANVHGVSITREVDHDRRIRYLFASDGTLLAERSFSDATDKKTGEVALIYTKYRMVSGIKFPIEARIVSSQIPGIASASFKVDELEINGAFEAGEFKLP